MAIRAFELKPVCAGTNRRGAKAGSFPGIRLLRATLKSAKLLYWDLRQTVLGNEAGFTGNWGCPYRELGIELPGFGAEKSPQGADSIGESGP
jgi:hypothetical protein